jgi:pimeloyl-ACP methyl ester carboxylesterase
MPSLNAAGRRLDYRRIDARSPDRPPLVFLHEGLGSIEQWRDFPDRVAEMTGCGAVVYSRYGYGRSDPLEEGRGVDYLHREALDSLPEVLAALDIREPILIGHSDGASIALIHAGAGRWPVRGLILEAPHVFVEDITIAGIVEAEAAYRKTDLAQRLGRYHTDVDRTFRGWCEAWLNPEFRGWNIEDCLPGIRCPVLLIQGMEDEYATMAQLDAIERQVSAPVQRLELANCGHTPHRDQPDAVLAAMTRFIEECSG